VLIGAAILLSNFGYLHFHWYNIFHLWPIFLVIAGVNLVFANNKSLWAGAIKIAVIVIGLGFLFFGNFGERYNFWPRHNFSYHSDDDDFGNIESDDNNDDSDSSETDSKMNGSGTFNAPLTTGTRLARLNITGGGTSYKISDTTNQLFTASTRDDDSRYSFSTSKEDSIYVVNFKMKDHKGFNFDSDKNEAEMRLNPAPIWDISVETGAASIDFDLSKFKVRDLKLHGGAAAFNIKLGAPQLLTNVDISTGVSGVEINIPENAACSIETASGLSDNHFEGFNKTRDNNFETPGFSTARNKIHIRISGGLSDFKVSRY
jgi:hypothetical protein